MEQILHLTSREAWAAAQAAGTYHGDTLESEGFIHCCTRRQLEGVRRRFFRGTQGLLLLVIDRARVSAPVRDEGADGDQFPHIYGPLNLDAVVRVMDYPPREDGSLTQAPDGSM